MNRLRTILLFFGIGIPSLLSAQDFYTQEQRDKWMAKAETNKPKLTEQEKKPVQLVKLEADDKAFQGWKATPAGSVDQLYQQAFKKQSGVVIDFGEHLTGYYTFTMKESANVLDGPLRFKMTFAEVPGELATPFDPYTGGLTRAWLQDEIITVMELPATITIPRRMAFRYLKIDLLAGSGNFDFKITDMSFKAVTAVTNIPVQLAANTDPMIKKVDAVGQATLKECMQTVYEDGPKRDRRLWIGDLYLESLANNYSFKDHELTKRCLYLIAGLSRTDGYLNANAFENPKPHAQAGAPFLFEYSLLFNAALKEYFIATKDSEFVLDLWPVAKRQMDNISKHLDDNGLFNVNAAQKDGWWIFVDWRDGLDKQASLQGIMIFTMKETLTLAKLLGKDKEVSQLNGLIDKMIKAAKTRLYDKKTGLFVSGASKQVSYASQAWMIMSGVASKAEGQKAMKAIAGYDNVVKPGTPYLYHYYIEALIKCGLTQEAKASVIDYWGGMVNKGADTFWEAYDPDNDKLSPYNFFPINSYCHAWSCTPVYFIRKHPEIFQGP